MTTHSHSRHHRLERRIDGASLVLLLLGIGFALFSYYLVTQRGSSPLILVPSIVAATIGATHLVKRQAPRR